jgi:hypothetical protein
MCVCGHSRGIELDARQVDNTIACMQPPPPSFFLSVFFPEGAQCWMHGNGDTVIACMPPPPPLSFFSRRGTVLDARQGDSVAACTPLCS